MFDLTEAGVEIRRFTFRSSSCRGCHDRHLLLHANLEWFDILVLAYPGSSGMLEVKQMKGSVKEPNKFHNYETEYGKSVVKPVTWKNISSCLVLPSERPLIYASLCMTISDGRTERFNIIAGSMLHHWLYE